jgi:photosystem II stability/assembly factor-like uncharacterized protein
MRVDIKSRLLSRAPNRQRHLGEASRCSTHTRANSIRTLATIAVPVDHDATPPMSTRALSLVVRLLTTACAGAALGTMTGCPLLFSCPEPWTPIETVALGTTADILALTQGGDFNSIVAIGAGGIVVHADDDGEATTSNPVNVDLRGVVTFAGTTLVVGDAGTILDSSDAGQSWTPRTSGIGDDLLAVARGALAAGNFLVAISNTQVLFSADDGVTWSMVAPPAQGWGVLRAVFATDSEIWVIGDLGVAWAASDPAGVWARQDLGTSIATTSLIAGGRVSGDPDSSYASTVALVSNSGLWFRKPDATEWIAASGELDGTIAAYGGGFVVTSAGTIYDVDENGRLSEVASVELTARAITGNWDGFVVAGEAGQAARSYFQACIGGRPWMLDGEITTAALEGEILVTDPVRRALAEAWAADALVEHASVAAFARVATELLSIGAPAELIRATQGALADELEHARMCFDLASRHAGARLGPGALAILAKPTNFCTVSNSRAGDPVAIALAMLEEGCINESVAAAEAAVAASVCRDPATQAVLARIAADETRHAALAWRTLRWLLDTHPEVAPALRTRFDQLASPMLPAHTPSATRPGLGRVAESDARTLRQHGRLSSRDRAAIRYRVFADTIAPIATNLRVVVTSGLALA